MLEHLRIENLILIRKAELRFGPGLNILTGETGAGKSAILAAIRLLCGEKADLQLLRDKTKPAVIEGQIRAKHLEADPDLLAPDGSCTFRREILPSGKSRAFINDRLISAAELKRLASQAIEFADQNGGREILLPSSQRALLDQWAGSPTALLAESYALQQKIGSDLARLKVEKERAHLATALGQEQIAEIEEISWKEGEDEELSLEHARLVKASEDKGALSLVQEELAEMGLPSLLRKMASRLPASEAASHLMSASIEIHEAERLLDRAASLFEADPHQLEKIEERIARIEKLKRKFGKTREEVQARLFAYKNELAEFEKLDENIALLEKELARRTEETKCIANETSRLRSLEAKRLEAALQEELRTLHLPHARFEVRTETKPLGADGCETVRFFFCANPGQPLQPLEECASGGEQSRVFFAFKVAFAQKEERSSLVLDEIDSNVGGIAASILGTKLKELGISRQIICITHFAQAAQHAHHHLLVEKTASGSDAETLVRLLSEGERQSEYTRMTGGRQFY